MTVFGGASLKDKLKLLFCVMLVSVPSKISKRLPYWLNVKKENIADILAAHVVVQADGVKYVLVDAESLTIVSPLYEAWMLSRLEVKPGETFLDVGAHIGKYSFHVAKKIGKGLVLSVEAHPENYLALEKGVKLNGFRNVIPVNVAAWDKKCRVKLYVGKKAGLHSLKGSPSSKYVIVEAEPLDDLLKDLNVIRVDWVKIDVEGAELEVLTGLLQSLQSHPALLIESFDHRKIIDFLRQFGYVAYRLPSGNFLFTHV